MPETHGIYTIPGGSTCGEAVCREEGPDDQFQDMRPDEFPKAAKLAKSPRLGGIIVAILKL